MGLTVDLTATLWDLCGNFEIQSLIKESEIDTYSVLDLKRSSCVKPARPCILLFD